jgi:tetratricopeptide (TPR) repeat protein
MHRHLRARLLAARGTAPPERSSCTESYARFRDGRAAAAASDATAALASFNDAIARLPANAVGLALASTAFGDCGFIADLFAERADLRERNGESATADWDTARSYSIDTVTFLKRRLALRRAHGDRAREIADLNEIVRLTPDDIDNRMDRGRALYELGDYPAAIADLDLALAKKPDHEVSLFYRALAHMRTKHYREVVVDASQILAYSPDNAAAFFLRSGAKYHLRQFDAALTDIDAALRIMPNHEPFKETRRNILGAMKLR